LISLSGGTSFATHTDMKRSALFVCVLALLTSTPAIAADQKADDPPPRVFATVVTTDLATIRPPALMPMYVGLAGLQGYDGYSTIRAMHGGANEQNPLVGGLANQPAAFWTLKAVSTLSTIYYAEQLWRTHHPAKAIVLMVVANGAMAAVAAHNTSWLASR
jgi:hypothetical protein